MNDNTCESDARCKLEEVNVLPTVTTGPATQTVASKICKARCLSVPYEWCDAETNSAFGVQTVNGKAQSYDASGYQSDYNLHSVEPDKELAAFLNDMTLLHRWKWIDFSTRYLDLSFTMYNPSADFWLHIRFMIEYPASGRPEKTLIMEPFVQNLNERPDDATFLVPRTNKNIF